VTDLWSKRAETYRGLADQREGADLELLVSWAEGETALDVASGGGHTANRLRAAGFRVTTLDPAPGMRADVLAPAEHIPFADSSFDVVTCRIAPHHFDDVEASMREMARVASRLVLIEDTLFTSNRVEDAEKLRDPTHVRSYTEGEWCDLLEGAGLRIEQVEILEKRRPLESWLARTETTGQEAEQVKALIADAIDDGDYVDRKILLKARKP
jgi:SAM-dependent methyltransferase